MKKQKLLVWGNVFLFLLFFVSAFSGLVLYFIFQDGSGFRGGRGVDYIFLGLAYRNWADIHNISSLIFVILAIIHFIFHWNLIKNLPKLIKN
jgi:hypothetical protein